MRYSLLWIFSLFLSCSLTDSDDVTPTFLNVSEVTVSPEPNQGSGSHNIEDLWVIVDGALVGIHQFPSKIPVLKTAASPTELRIFGGIRRNGINSDAIEYPFYQQIIQPIDLIEGETINLDVEFKYRTDATFAFVESFDNSNNFTQDEDGNPMTSFVSSNEDPREGFASGVGKVDAENSVLELATDASFSDLPTNGAAIYLEMEYRSNLTLNVGLIGSLGTIPLKNYFLFLKPTGNSWNKIYVELTSEILGSNLDAYKLVFGIEYNGEDTNGAEGFLNLDNVKVIHF